MNFRELVTISRSYRRFDNTVQVSEATVRDLVELATYIPSARNLQPLKYIAVCNPATVAALYPYLSWAGYLSDWDGPIENERPTAYLVMLGDTSISTNVGCDSGIAAQTIMLGATAAGFGGCIIASLQREKIRTLLSIPDHLSLLMVIALGKPVETVVIDEMESESSVRYYRDQHNIHHVPKRRVDDVLLKVV